MTIQDDATIADRRARLSRERVLGAAVELADRGGIDALSMRKLGQVLRVDAMAIYRHVRDKDDLLDSMLGVVVGGIEPTSAGTTWKDALREQAMAARSTMLRHPWARRVLEERGTGGPAAIAQIERVLAILLGGGFPLELAHHALHVLDSRIFGFSPALFDETGRPQPSPEETAELASVIAGRFPNVARLAGSVSHGGALGACDDDVEFAFGLDLVLDGLERLSTS
jgi:AcrR family transcriptional regulator